MHGEEVGGRRLVASFLKTRRVDRVKTRYSTWSLLALKSPPVPAVNLTGLVTGMRNGLCNESLLLRSIFCGRFGTTTCGAATTRRALEFMLPLPGLDGVLIDRHSETNILDVVRMALQILAQAV